MVRFGRVEGVVAPVERGCGTWLLLTVYLETGARLEIVREEVLRPLRPVTGIADLAWHADQLTQETIGVDLTARGWEAIAAGELPEPEAGALARSASYVVRHVG